MENTAEDDWTEVVPWWLDGVPEADLIECGEQLAVAAVGPGAEAIRLLTSLAGQALTREESLTVIQLWQPQLAWVTGAEQTAIIAQVGLPQVGLPVVGGLRWMSSRRWSWPPH